MTLSEQLEKHTIMYVLKLLKTLNVPYADGLYSYLKSNPTQLENAVTAFNKGDSNYQSGWNRVYNNNTLVLDTKWEYAFLDLFIKGCGRHNQYRIGRDDLINRFGTDKDTVKRTIKSLVDKGCIAIIAPGKKNKKTRYMVNPILRSEGSLRHYDSMVNLFNNYRAENSFCREHDWLKPLYGTQDVPTNKRQKVAVNFEDINTLWVNEYSATKIDSDDK